MQRKLFPYRPSVRLSKGKINWTLPFLSGEFDVDSDASPSQSQPRYAQISVLRDSIEAAVLQEHLREAVTGLHELAKLVSPNDRAETILHVRFANRYLEEQRLELPHTDVATTQDSLIEATLREANRCYQIAVAQLQRKHEPRRRANGDGNDANAPEFVDANHSVIRTNDLRVAYGKRLVLQNIAIRLTPGQILGVVGVNGAGKTTLLEVLSGVRLPTGGTIRYPLLEEQYNSQLEILNKVQLIRQVPNAWSGTVKMSLRMFASLRGIARVDSLDEVAYVIAKYGLTEFQDHTFSELSAGYKTRYELAKAAINRPQLLLLDEPLGPLDPITRRFYLRALKSLVEMPGPDIGIILSSQDTFSVEQVASDILIIDNQTATSLATANLTEGESLTFELVADASDELLSSILSSIPELAIDLNQVPCRISAPSSVTVESILKNLFSAGVRVDYFRDLTKSSERFLAVEDGPT